MLKARANGADLRLAEVQPIPLMLNGIWLEQKALKKRRPCGVMKVVNGLRRILVAVDHRGFVGRRYIRMLGT